MNKEEHKGFLISHDCDMLGRAQQNNVFISKKVISRKLPVCRHAVYLKRRKTPNIDLVLTSILVLFLHMLTYCVHFFEQNILHFCNGMAINCKSKKPVYI